MTNERRVSSFELFFDLVFVFTITQLAHLLEDHLTGEGLFQVVLVFIVLFWMYGAFAWLTNQVPPDTAGRQIWLTCGMGGFLVCGLAIPHAFDQEKLLFGLGYLWVVLVHTALYARVFGVAVWRFSPMNIVMALLVIASSTAELRFTYILWVAAILMQILPPLLTSRAGPFDVHPAHFVERHGLLMIVAFGESVIAIGAAIDPDDLDVTMIAAAILALALCAAMWWQYFAFDPERAEHMLAAASSSERVRAAHGGYFYAFIPMLLGVVMMATGVKETLGHFTATIESPVALVLAGGVALYLFGQLVFRFAMRFEIHVLRLIAPGLALACAVLGVTVSTAAELTALVLVLVIVAFADFRNEHSGSSTPSTA